MSYLFSDSQDVTAAAQFGQDAADAMLPRPHRAMLPRQAARRAAMLSRRAKRRGLLPGMSGMGDDPTDPREMFLKYEEKNLRYARTLETVRSDGTKRELRDALAPLTAEYGRIKAAFTSGSAPGSRDISRMKDWAEGLNSFSRTLTAAIKRFGTGSTPAVTPPVSTPISKDVFVGPPAPPKAPEPESEGVSPILIGVAALAAILVLSK
jgi:hypothetical protein